jgi:hypothetical protein
MIPQQSDSRIGAFSDNNLTYLTVPDSVTYIGKWSFAKNKIGSLMLGSSVETIGIYSFYNNRIHILDLPDSMRVLSHGSFEYNPIDTINFNDGLTAIHSWSFGSGTGALSEVNVPSTVTKFDYLLIFNESIKEFNLPQSLATTVDITKMQYNYTMDPITEIRTYTYFNSSYFNFY